MAKTWYPVIDYLECKECGSCIQKCSHGVYDTAKVPSPVVVNPESCIDHCHGCGNLCPQGAITYVGDDTGWLPPNGEKQEDEMVCCCNNDDKKSGKKVSIEYLYLDLQSCDRCIGTDVVLDEVLLTVTPALAMAGYEVELKKVEIKTAELAEQYQFLASPTIRVNGRDICKSVAENVCGCCSDISGTSVDCRVFEYEGEIFEVPPKAMIAQAILQSVFGLGDTSDCHDEYQLPQNLKDFFDGKSNKSKCSCTGNCC